MAAIQTLKGAGVNVPQFQPLTGYFNRTPLPAPEVDTREASKIAGKTAMYGAIGKVLSELPEKIREAYKEGRKLTTGSAVEDKFNSALQTNDTKALADFKATGEGAVAFQPVDQELRQAQLDAYGRRSTGHTAAPVKQPIYDNILSSFGETSAATPAAASGSGEVAGTVFGMVPDGEGGWMDDPNDITDAHVPGFSSTKGAFGHDIKDPQLEGVAISPAQLKAAGINPSDHASVAAHRVRVTSPNGVVKELPIVDLLGTPGKVDFTAKSYTDFGGPMNRGGGTIPGLKYEVIPARGTAAAAPVTDPEAEAQIANAADQLQNLPLSGLSAENVSGPIAAADIKPPLPLAGFDPTKEVRRPTVGINRQMGKAPVAIIAPTPDKVTAVYPGDKQVDITPPKTSKVQGLSFQSAEAARLAGYDPTGATVNPDGSVTITSYKPSGTDVKGRAKITDTQKAALGSAAVLSKSIDDLMVDYDAMDKAGKAGPIAGRIEKGKQAIGIGSEEGSRVQAEMNTSLFKIARMLNGAGVLTDKDIKRAEQVAPTITMGRDQFKGQLTAVKSTIKDGLETWLRTNAGQATDEQVALAKEAITSLGGVVSEAAGGISGSTGMVRIKAPDGTIKPVRADAAQKYIDKGGVVVE